MTAIQPDYIFTGEYLLQGGEGDLRHVLKKGGIAVSGDTILAVDTAEHLALTYPDVEIINEPHGLILPGLINSHTHAAMSCFRGLADDLPLMTWLEKHIFPIESKLTGEMVFQASLLSIAEMIKSGTTSFCDMYLFSQDVARAAETAGIRAWIGEVLYDFPSPCYGEVDNGIALVSDQIAQYRDHHLITITVDPHSVYTCSPALLSRLGSLAAENDSLYVIHLSENDTEVETCLHQYGLRPIKHLEKLGLLSPKTVGCHCVNISDSDFNFLAAHNVKVVHCAESNMKLASGIAPVVEMLKRNITVCLGTDGSASNNDVDMLSEMNSVAKMQKINSMDPTVMTADQTFAAATIWGARTLGAEDTLGSLIPGKKADFIVIDLNQPHLVPMYNILSHLTYVARGGDVIHSFVGGRQLMKNRQLLTIDEERLLAEMRSMSETIIRLRN